jgi:hypothetical protein
MGSISMEKEALAKQREIPMQQEENNDDHSRDILDYDVNIRLEHENCSIRFRTYRL